ncbi:MAG: hypothetical protein FWC64_00555 [Treponema sp.]|nr:hypothetical protein [Treponema sp.]
MWYWERHENVGVMIVPAIGYRLGGRRPWGGWAWSWHWNITVAAPVLIGTEGISPRFHPGVALGVAW